MMNENVVISCISLISISFLLSGCFEAVKKQQADMDARGTIEAGGYTWKIPAESAGGNTIETRGMPSKQIATEASDKLCKKHGRIAQFVKQKSHLTGRKVFDFNCVK